MKRSIWLFTLLFLTLFALVFGSRNLWSDSSWSNAQLQSIEAILQTVNESRLSGEGAGINFAESHEVNVLLLGLDARKEDENPHCDAIHLFTLDVQNWDIHITTVPRGTYAYIPLALESSEYYLANACSYMGLEYGIEQIERTLGVQTDYVVSVNFSQTLGILRLFDMPTTQTLQWLRHRHSYQIGEPQRAHNQAVFLKDMIVEHAHKFERGFTVPMQYLLYSFVDTDMDFATARALLEGYIDANIDERANDINLSMKPYYQTVDYHFDPERIDEQIAHWQSFLQPYLSQEDLSLATLEDIQNSLILYMQHAIESREGLERIIDEQLWWQVEDVDVRAQLHYELVTTYARTLEDPQAIIDLLSLYILQQEAMGEDAWARKAKSFLATMVE